MTECAQEVEVFSLLFAATSYNFTPAEPPLGCREGTEKTHLPKCIRFVGKLELLPEILSDIYCDNLGYIFRLSSPIYHFQIL